MKKKNNKSGQTMVEYIIIVVIVAVAALAIFGLFSDKIQDKMVGATNALDSTGTASRSADSTDVLKSLDTDGSHE
jgi:Flp pilus assembly pilin Flp